ncbi:MAG: DMT family transporter [Anaerolineae bacterium]
MTRLALKISHLSSHQLAVLLMIGSAAAWATGTVMSKFSLSYFPPLPLFVTQLAASVIVLWIVVILRHQKPHRNWKLLRLGWTGLLEPGLAFVLVLVGLSRTTASVSTFIGATESFMVIVFAYFILRERVSRRTLLLMVGALCGVLMISLSGGDQGAHSVFGDGLVLAGTACAALYVVLSSRSVAEMEPLPLCALQQTFGLMLALLVLPAGLGDGEFTVLLAIPVTAWIWALLNGLVQYALAFILYLMALKGMPATRAALFLTLIPIFGVIESALFLGEQMTLIQLAGGAIILATLLGLNVKRQTA